MTIEQTDFATFEGTIARDASETLEVKTEHADTVIIFLDDGTTGETPADYDMTQRIYHQELDDYMWYSAVQKENAKSWVDPAFAEWWQVEITNVSNSDANFRIMLKSFRDMD